MAIKRQAASRGFTLIELIVVLVIAGMVVAVAPPLIAKVIPGVQLKSAAQKLAKTLQYAHNRAVYQREEQQVVVDTERHLFYIQGDKKQQHIPEGVEIEAMSAEAESFSDNQSVYAFYPSGGATGGRVTLSDNGRSYKVDVDWLTGRVRVFD